MTNDRPDFPEMLDALIAGGMSYYKIALAVGVTHTTVEHWRMKKVEPRYTPALRLIELYRVNCENTYIVPRETGPT